MPQVPKMFSCWEPNSHVLMRALVSHRVGGTRQRPPFYSTGLTAFVDHSACTTMSMEESISLEETNKIRISLGLKPLTDDSAPADDADKQAEQNYNKQREREAKEREAK
ncbi:hypothetical protein V8B97DRAFT_1646828 [Scleroderma yunnanense]